MPARHTGDEQQSLLQNAYIDEDNAGGFVGDEHGAVDTNFLPATLPTDQQFDDVYLQPDTQVLISNAPSDRYRFTYIVFYLLGIATMTPWNFFITAEDYWMYKFRNTTINETTDIEPILTPMQKSFTCDLTLTASISGTTFLILNAIYGHRVSLRLRVLGTLCIIFVIFIITTVFVEINTDKWQEQFFLLTLFTVVLINVSSATMSGGIMGVAGLFPSKYMTALVSGQALGGILTALTFILVLTIGTAPQTTAFIYFTIGSLLIVLCIVSYILLERRPFYKYYLDGGDKYKIISATPSHSRVEDTGVALEPNIGEVFSKIYVDVFSVCLLFATTLSVYPGVTVLMQSQNYGNGSAWSDIYYLPVVNYLFFNVGDYFGRLLAGWIKRPAKNSHTVMLFCFLRIIYVPFFLCSNSNQHNFLPTLVQTDVAFIIMILTFALSNGYLTNIALIMVPNAVKQHEKEAATSIMAASLSCGLAFGSLLSMVFVQLL